MKKSIILLMLFISSSISGQFIEKAQQIGIDHVFSDLSSMGGGAVFFDYDNDGWEDLYITGGFNEDSMYKNKGDGTFEKVTNIGFSLTDEFNTLGVVSGDVNKDGFKDLFVTTWRSDDGFDYARNLLFINNGNGTFSEKGEDWNIGVASFSMGAIMLDYNKDGELDIYVINYQETSRVTYDSAGNVNGFDHDCFDNQFYENNGDGTFTEKAAALGLSNIGCALASMPTDYDQDNDQDIYLANDFGEFIFPNSLFRNNYPTSSFTDVSSQTQTNIGIYAMGLAYGDFDKDQDFDYYITNLGRNVLLRNNGSSVFTDISTSAGVENTYALDGNGLLTTGWGTAFLDVNNDTWQDLFVANGRVPAAPFIATGEQDPNMLYINNGDSTFTGEILSGDNLNRGRGMAYSDYDKDGDLDIVVVVQEGSISTNPKTVFFQNQLNPNENNDKNWVQFNLKGISINPDAIGAKVKVKVNGETLLQEVHGQGSHCSQHSLVLHFGLASYEMIDEVEIIWSESSSQVFADVEPNKRYDLIEGQSLSINDVNLSSEALLYPNPIKNNLHVNNIEEDSEISIFTTDGKMLFSTLISEFSNKSIDLSFLSQGIYLVNLKNSKQNISKLFVKK